MPSEKTKEGKLGFGKKLFQNTITHYNYYFNAVNRLQEIVDQAKEIFRDDYTKKLPFFNFRLNATASNSDIDTVINKCNAGILLHDLRNDWVDNLYLVLGQAYYYRKNFDSANQVFQYINYAFAPKDDGYDIPVGSNASAQNGVFSIATVEKKENILRKTFSTPQSRNDALVWMARNFIENHDYDKASSLLEILRHDPVFPERLQPELHETLSYLFYQLNMNDSAAYHLGLSLDLAATKLEYARKEFLMAQLYHLAGDNDNAIKYYNKAASHTTDPIMEVYANLNSIADGAVDTTSLLQQKLDNLLRLAKKDKYADNRDIIYAAAAKVAMDMNNAILSEKLLNKSITSSTDNPQQKSKSFLALADMKYDQALFSPAKNFYDSVDASSLEETEKARLHDRLPPLTIISNNLTTIYTQDSLQALAKLSENDRIAAVKKIVKYLRKLKGLADEPEININAAIPNQAPITLFSTNNGDWYFNNTTLKSQGYSQFRANWGNRPNVDDWQRREALLNMLNSKSKVNKGEQGDENALNSPDANNGTNDQDISFASLMSHIPLTEELMNASNLKIMDALLENGLTFQNQLENYPAAVESYGAVFNRFPGNDKKALTLFNLYYCYYKLGNITGADSAKNALLLQYPESEWAIKLKNPVNATAEKKPDAATQRYKDIYTLFIEGNFEKAKSEKLAADSIYGQTYWTPQLLYIESIYYVTEREDSIAINSLENLAKLFPQSPLVEKANTMIEVLRHRKDIEDYLTALQITRLNDDESPVVDLTPVQTTIQKPNTKVDSLVSNPVKQVTKNISDTSHQANTVIRTYEFDAKQPQFVTILLDKVAPVFINEARNAFDKYNKINFYNQKLAVSAQKIDDRYAVVLIGPFAGASEAIEYVDKTRPVAGSRIISWLTPDKFKYTIISQYNLDILKETKDLNSYKQLLEKVLPGKFE
ncbi:MAG: hypothetical protein JSS67_11050 [Bacteroidetes bacterium]|nr:hypothetical protein [Bacteroidota bacterium]